MASKGFLRPRLLRPAYPITGLVALGRAVRILHNLNYTLNVRLRSDATIPLKPALAPVSGAVALPRQVSRISYPDGFVICSTDATSSVVLATPASIPTMSWRLSLIQAKVVSL